jgi:hypothetical protein
VFLLVCVWRGKDNVGIKIRRFIGGIITSSKIKRFKSVKGKRENQLIVWTATTS